MSGTSVTVKPGPPQQLSGANWNNGAMLYNPDPVNAVWVSSRSSVSPGNGARLPALGTLNWSSTSGQPWACVDTGVATTVTIQVSDDANNPTDPLAVAVQTALQTAEAINALGVPNVLVEKIFINQQVFAPGAAFDFDITAYSSLEIDFGTTGGAELNVHMTQTSVIGGFLIGTDDVYSSRVADISVATFPAKQVRWQAIGTTLTIFNQSATTSLIVTAKGSNRVLPKRLSTGMADGSGYHGSVAFAAAGVVSFPQQIYTGNDTTQIEGPCYLRFGLGGGNTTRGQLQCVTKAGTIVVVDRFELQADGTSAIANKLTELPAGGYVLQANITTFVGASNAVCDIIPAL